MLGIVLSLLCVSERARAEIATAAVQTHTPLAEQAREKIEHAALALRRMVPVVLLVPALTLNETITREMPQKRVSSLDASMREDIIAKGPAYYCYGPGCAMTVAVLKVRGDATPRSPQLGSTRFLTSLGSGPASVLAYFCSPTKAHATTWRFGLVSAVGGPAFGLRVRW